MQRRQFLTHTGAATLAGLTLSGTMGQALAQEIVVWHDLGENGIKWFQAMSAEFAKQRPGVTIKSVSYPTDQWFGRSISALNTDTGMTTINQGTLVINSIADSGLNSAIGAGSVINIGSAATPSIQLNVFRGKREWLIFSSFGGKMDSNAALANLTKVAKMTLAR